MQIKFKGDYALFSRPEFKADPHSYPVPPPTAVKGMLESIFWKPEFTYQINEIIVLNPIRFTSMLRNMGQSNQSEKTAKTWAKNGLGRYNITEDRSQRNHVILKDVAYIIDFDIKLEPHANDPLQKYLAQLERRIKKGQYFKHPAFGCREYIAYFQFPKGDEIIHPEIIGMGKYPIGTIPLKIDFIPDKNGSVEWRDRVSRKLVKGNVSVKRFQAVMDKGRVEVPPC